MRRAAGPLFGQLRIGRSLRAASPRSRPRRCRTPACTCPARGRCRRCAPSRRRALRPAPRRPKRTLTIAASCQRNSPSGGKRLGRSASAAAICAASRRARPAMSAAGRPSPARRRCSRTPSTGSSRDAGSGRTCAYGTGRSRRVRPSQTVPVVFDAVDHRVEAELERIDAPFFVEHRVAVKARGDAICRAWRRAANRRPAARS